MCNWVAIVIIVGGEVLYVIDLWLNFVLSKYTAF